MNLDGYVTVNERLKMALAKYPDLRVMELPFLVQEINGDTFLWCAVAVYTEDEWQCFCDVIGKPELKDDPKYASMAARKENEEDLDAIVNEWTSSRSA